MGQSRSGRASQTAVNVRQKNAGLSPAGFLILRYPGLAEQRHHQQSHNVDDLDQRVDGRTGGVFVRIADGVASNCSFVGIRALAATVADFDVLFGIVPGAAASRHRDGDEQARHDRAEEQAARRLRPILKRSLWLRQTATLQSKKNPAHGRAFLDPLGVAPT